MPTYDYLCESCGHEWELFQKITDDPVKKCPGCKKNKAARQFGTGAAIVFKGSGFYQTDYRSESYKKGQKAAKKQSESKSEGKSEGKAKSPDGSSKSNSSGSKNSGKSSSGEKS